MPVHFTCENVTGLRVGLWTELLELLLRVGWGPFDDEASAVTGGSNKPS